MVFALTCNLHRIKREGCATDRVLEYFLRTARLYARTSRVLLLGTHADLLPSMDAANEVLRTTMAQLGLSEGYAVSAKTGGGIDALKHGLVRTATHFSTLLLYICA